MKGIEEILEAHCGGQSTLDEAATALALARRALGIDDADVESMLDRYVASGALSAEAAAVLAGPARKARGPVEMTMLRPAGPDSGAAPPPSPKSAPPETSGGASSGWRRWAEADHQGARIGVGDVLRERFVIEENIGEGGMGLVFRARDRRREEARDRNPFVAIKLLGDDFKSHPDALIALQREARRMQQLSHPNIAAVYDFDRDGPHVYLVMELLEGEALDRILTRNAHAALPLEQTRRVIEGAGSALRHAHSRGVVHSDFKPANVFVTRSGEVKVIDFGIARIAQDSTKLPEAAKTVFDAGQLGAWTNAYASPEQILQAAQPDPRDDIYAFGLVVYEMLSGKHPFGRKSAVEARFKEMKLEPIPGLTPAQNTALASALDFDRDRRLDDISGLMRAFVPSDEPIVATREGVPRTHSAAASTGAAPRRKTWRIAALAIIGLAWVGFFGAYRMTRESPPEAPGGTATVEPAPASTPALDSPTAPAAPPAAASQAGSGPTATPVARPAAPPKKDPARESSSVASAGSEPKATTSTSTPAVAAAGAAPVTADDSKVPDASSSGAGDEPRVSGTGPEAPADESVAASTGEATDEASGTTAPAEGKPSLYRWVDKDGIVQFGEEPPAEYAESAVKVMDL